MTTDTTTTADRIAMALGGGLITLGVVVLGLINTLANAPTVPAVEEGEIVATPMISPEIRAYLVALGLLVWLVYALYKLTSVPPGTTDEREHPGAVEG
ncbi:hypothetical protein [Salinilacihabitans rarus]|uniref:hypothetical protein n=1 Tax=Salinilacihabitans rarus TaxID=2961596 RepID=UPI0020C8B266|nr:hypothetical protein [Salinilacihabitans rarus]